MESIIVRGGRPLSGEVRVEGAKNSALKLMAAALLAPGVTRISNVPQISDVEVMVEVLEGLKDTVALCHEKGRVSIPREVRSRARQRVRDLLSRMESGNLKARTTDSLKV